MQSAYRKLTHCLEQRLGGVEGRPFDYTPFGVAPLDKLPSGRLGGLRASRVNRAGPSIALRAGRMTGEGGVR